MYRQQPVQMYTSGRALVESGSKQGLDPAIQNLEDTASDGPSAGPWLEDFDLGREGAGLLSHLHVDGAG